MKTKLNGITLYVEPDHSPPHPRRDNEHLGTLLVWHRRYDLSDNCKYQTPNDFLESEESKNIYVQLPVYLLDHSALYLSTTDFKDPWDSGRLGLIYCTKEQVKRWYGYIADEQTVMEQLRGEVALYDDYLNGSWYQFYIEGLNGEIEDSCGGFFQDKDFKSLLNDMKEYVAEKHEPLFDNLIKQVEKHSYM